MSYSASTSAEGAEGGGLDRVDAGLEVLVVHLADEVGPGEHEVLVAALERGAAEVVGAEVLALDPGAERAVEDQDALAQGGEELGHCAPGYRRAFARSGRPSFDRARGPARSGCVLATRTARSARAHSSRSPELSP